MPTLDARLDSSVDATELSAQLSVQVDLIAAAQALLAALDDAPPEELGDLLDVAGDLQLPRLGAVGTLAGVFADLDGAIPTDLDELTAPLLQVVGSLVGEVGTEVVATIRGALDAVLAVQALLDLDLTCAPAGSADGDGGDGDGGGGNGGDDGGDDGGGDGDGDGDGTATRRGAERAAAVATLAGAVLDTLPDPLDAPTLLRWIADRVAPDDFGLPLGFPLMEDLREPVQRLLAWDGMAGTEIRDEIATTLTAVGALLDSTVGGVVADVEDLAATLTTGLGDTDLAAVAADVVTRLAALAADVGDGDADAAQVAADALDATLDDLDAVAATLDPALTAAAGLEAALRDLPDDLERSLGRVDAALVGSTGVRGVLGTVAETGAQQATAEAVEAVVEAVRGAGAWVEDLLAALDLSAVSEPIAEVTATVTDALGDLDAALLDVAVAVRTQLETATALLDEVDPADLRQELSDAVDDLTTDLTTRLGELAAPARAAVSAAVDAFADAIGALDPAAVLSALTDVVDAVAGVLADPSVAEAIASVRDAIDEAVDQLAEQPITPVTDAVVAAVDEVAELLRGLETDALPGPAKLALQGALAALPRSLDPVTDPLVDELDELIAAGPMPFLARVRAGPAAVTERIRGFDPAALVGPTLSAPWQQLVDRADAVGPAMLFGPLEDALDELRQRVRAELDPAAALAPLAGPHRALLAAVDGLDPAALVGPVEEALGAAAASIRDAVGDDGILAPVASVVAAVDDAVGTVRSVVTTLERVRQVLSDLSTLDEDLVAWVDAIFAKIAATADDGSLATAVTTVDEAIGASRAATLLARVEAAVTPVRTALVALAPDDRLAAVTRARRAITAADVATLPPGAPRDAVEAVLDRCDPLSVGFARPFHDLAGLAATTVSAETDLPARLADWDGRHHAPDGVLAGYTGLDPDPASLGQQARESLDERFLDPAVAVLRTAGLAGLVLGGLADELAAVLAAADDRLADLTAGPEAFLAVRDEVVALADRVAGADLAVVTDALEDVVGTVRAGVVALSPTALAADLAGAIDDVVAVVDLDLVLPPAELATIETAYQQGVDTLRGLDPGVLVTDVVGPAYEEAVTPLVDAIDLTPTIDALVARLEELPEELRAELDRVDAAYQELLRAAPSIDLTDLSIEIDVEIDVPSPF